ncbi:MAG: hypothetical protein FWC58_01220 [Desulfobulbus sp.]|nr:hypothetical protein [Desulfobulbus sp.]
MAAFSSAFAAPFAKDGEAGFIAPVMAQAALVAGEAVESVGTALTIGGRTLIGTAGKVYAFASKESAERWIEHTRAVAINEAAIVEGMSVEGRALWLEKKRARLAAVAGRVVGAAARLTDAGRRAALLAESDFCLNKWG